MTIRRLGRGAIAAACAASGALFPAPVASACKDAPAAPRPVDLALCLDTSGSMDGLIEAAKHKLWAIVNELATARPLPRLRVALLTYGNDGHDPEDGWVRVDCPFTDDLDTVSQRLFALSTNGGSEYVGRVLNRAAGLGWTDAPEALRLAVVAGNESADQDAQTPFRDVCRALIARGIMVNAIYCGPEHDEIAPGWREVARLADGQFACIDQDGGTVVVETPFDAELTALSRDLNRTYVPFGSAGADGAANQWAQDSNAQTLGAAAAASRAATKAQGLYRCTWDLVDACASGQVQLAEVQADQLPAQMQPMTPQERAAYVQEQARKRSEIQGRINELGARRQSFIEERMKAGAVDESSAFDAALRRAVREQARSKGFSFPQPEAPAAAEPGAP